MKKYSAESMCEGDAKTKEKEQVREKESTVQRVALEASVEHETGRKITVDIRRAMSCRKRDERASEED